MEERILKSHKISIFNRSSGIISGVKEVISFDPNEIILDTEQGMLMIQGEELHVTKLTVEKGEVEIEGLVYSMVYSDEGGMTGEKGLAKEVIPLDGKQKNSRGNHKTTAAFFS